MTKLIFQKKNIGLGKRKEAVARVFLVPGEGNLIINKGQNPQSKDPQSRESSSREYIQQAEDGIIARYSFRKLRSINSWYR